ncbi:MAG: hypothetical protein VYA34_05750 [Myxococcota bacterium]|nr:hypothetical protein [Myxococcota bacterium]
MNSVISNFESLKPLLNLQYWVRSNRKTNDLRAYLARKQVTICYT